ncbi:MAG: hypothetical protein DRG50_07460 [Deltaproteobacteria bacterium]|nr:MAG: hypothetical protein DRG50_07460 [Deltaproteobacteria bacterium]
MGPFAWSFLGVETFMGKVIPLILVLNPRTRTVWWTALASVLVVVGIFVMRCNIVLGGEYLPLI